MVDVVVIRLKTTKGMYFASPNLIDVVNGDIVVFETENGLQLGEICSDVRKEKEKMLICRYLKLLD